MDRIPQIRSVMTPFPHSVAATAVVADALAMMSEHEIAHLPVQHDEALVGVVSEVDIERALDPDMGLPPKDRLRVRQVMTADPYTVDLRAPLDSVALTMAERRIDCALVLRQGRLVGVFTSTDACRLLGDYLRALRPPQGDDAA